MKRLTLLIPDLVVAAVYFVVAAAALILTRFEGGGGIAFLWLATPVLIAVLLRRRRRSWPPTMLLCGVASFIATGLFGLGWALAAPFALVNLIEAYVAATLLRRARYARNELGSVPWLIHFVASVGIAAPLVGGLLAALSLAVAGRDALDGLMRFYPGHALGNITFVPLLSLLLSRGLGQALRKASRRRTIESTALLSLVAVTTAMVFSQDSLPLLFLPMLPVILSTFRVRNGAAMGIVVVALIGGGLTLAGRGPIAMMYGTPGAAIHFFQFYLAATVLTVLPVAADLRHRARLHRELRLSEARYRLLSDQSTDIVMHLERDGRIRFVSPSIKQMGGYEPRDLIGQNANVMIAPAHRERVRDAHHATILAEGATNSYDYEAITSDGRLRWFETHSRAVINEDGELDGVVSFVRDVTVRKATEQLLRAAALTDPLTELPNRRAFREIAGRRVPAAGETPRHAVAILDFDHFKAVNDRFGHDAGDAVLREFAIVARTVLRPTDLVARLGGEEFALFLPDTGRDAAVAICERLRAAMAGQAIHIGGRNIGVTISGGVAELGPTGLDASLKRADAALYLAKHLGRDRITLAA